MKILFKLLFLAFCFATGGHLVRALFNGEIEYISYRIDPNPVFSFSNEPYYFLLFFLFYILIFGLSLWVLIFPNKAKKYMKDKSNKIFNENSNEIDAEDYEPILSDELNEFQRLQNEYSQQLEVAGNMMKNGKSEDEVMEYLNSLKDPLPEMENLSKEVLEDKLSSLQKRTPKNLKILNKILILVMVVIFIYFLIRILNII